MILREYEDFVISLASAKSMASEENKLATAGLGLAGEAGEVTDLVKKVLFHPWAPDWSITTTCGRS